MRPWASSMTLCGGKVDAMHFLPIIESLYRKCPASPPVDIRGVGFFSKEVKFGMSLFSIFGQKFPEYFRKL